MPTDYAQPFQITGPAGNNALSFSRRGPSPSLWVPSAISGSFDDVRTGERVVFEDFDEHGTLRSCSGLAHLVRTDWDGIPAVVVDNHNHAFYFWYEALLGGRLERGATLVHIDQHRDTRVPEREFSGTTIEDAFEYTNFHLNVGNYVVPAKNAGIVGDIHMVTGQEGLRDVSVAAVENKILNIDLDFFAPEMAVDFDAAARFIGAHLQSASLVTIATSPFFIDQAAAIGVLQRLVSAARLNT